MGLEKKRVAVIGAGPKAAALAAKAAALRKCKVADIEILVFERRETSAHWMGVEGYTDGEGTNVTPPEKDVGFPYGSKFGLRVDSVMIRNYSWAAYMIVNSAYADWVDRGSPRPRHAAWGRYISWVLGRAFANIQYKTVKSIERAPGNPERLLIKAEDLTSESTYEVDGVVFTGPGPIRKLLRETEGCEDIDDAQTYWLKETRDSYAKITSGKVAVIGAGETAANVAISVLHTNSSLTIEIINRHGTLFSRGNSYFENQLFSSNTGWPERSLENRSDIMKRLDRGFVSAKSLARLSDSSERVAFRTAEVESVKKVKNEIHVFFKGQPEAVPYVRVINATGFNPRAVLQLLSDDLRPASTTDEEIDDYLRLPAGEPRANIHVPMLAGISQGPGIPGLSSLGLLADLILRAYVPRNDGQRAA